MTEEKWVEDVDEAGMEETMKIAGGDGVKLGREG